MNMNRRIITLAAVLLAVATVAGADSTWAQEKPKGPSIAVVDAAFLLQNAKAAKNLRAQISKIRTDFQRDINTKQEELEKLSNDLARERPGISVRTYQLRLRELRLRDANHQSDAEESESMLDRAFRGASDKISEAIEQVVDQIVKERKFSLVLPRSSIIGTPAVPDITQEVLKRLDQRMPSVAVDMPK